MNLQEDFCSQELYKLLIDKGFEVDCYDAPFTQRLVTHQSAMKWLREKHDWYISIGYYEDDSTDADGNIVETWWFWGYDIIGLPSGGIAVECCDEYYSYEEAVEAALLYVLKNLI